MNQGRFTLPINQHAGKWEGMTPTSSATEPLRARKTKRSAFVGKGAAVQFLGVVCCFLFLPFGLLPGIALLIVGSSLSFIYRCDHCGNRVEKETRVCPHPNCGVRFSD